SRHLAKVSRPDAPKSVELAVGRAKANHVEKQCEFICSHWADYVLLALPGVLILVARSACTVRFQRRGTEAQIKTVLALASRVTSLSKRRESAPSPAGPSRSALGQSVCIRRRCTSSRSGANREQCDLLRLLPMHTGRGPRRKGRCVPRWFR